MNLGQYTLKMHANCGMSYEIRVGDREECSRAFDQYVKDKKKLRARTSPLSLGEGQARAIELTEPDDAWMVPDWAGQLILYEPPRGECKWCGQRFVLEVEHQRFCSDECSESYNS